MPGTALRQRRPRRPLLVNGEEQQVGLRRGDRCDMGQIGDARRDGAGQRVILGQPFDVVVERVQAHGRQHAGLAHGAAHHLLEAPCFFDEVPRAGEDGTHGRAQTLGEIDPHAVVSRCMNRGFHTRSNHGVHEPGAVHMCGKTGRLRSRGYGVELRHRPDRAALEIEGLLHAHEPGPRRVAAGEIDPVVHIFGAENTVGRIHRVDHSSGQRGWSAAL